MRNEQQVLEQILAMAVADDEIRVVMLNGSRLNINAPKDIMQDYDVCFFVRNISNIHYKEDRSWIKDLGELVMLQQNDFDEGSYIFLMQFKDGVRIDLSFGDIGRLNSATGEEDSLSKILLDKDHIAKELPEPDDSSYFVKKPSPKEWNETINELWWIQIYIGKEIWRDELPFAKYLYEQELIGCLRKLLAWHIGEKFNWRVNVGKYGKWFKRLLEEDLYEEYKSIYCGADYTDMWNSLFKAGPLIRWVGTELGRKLGYAYPLMDDVNTSEFIRRLHELPSDAEDFVQ